MASSKKPAHERLFSVVEPMPSAIKPPMFPDISKLRITHVLFDMDGLMLDTEDIYKEVYASLLKRYGKEYTTDSRFQYVGMSDGDAAEAIIRIFDLPMTKDEFLSATLEAAKERVPSCKLMPGFERLHTHLHSRGVPTALATSTVQETFDLKTVNHKTTLERFHHIVIGGSDPEVKQCKPSPDIFLVAARRFPNRPPPEKCLVFEDAANGVKAAIAAGMPVVAVPDPDVDKKQFQGATQILNSLEEFQPELFGLPAY